jgi:hypothetical protein
MSDWPLVLLEWEDSSQPVARWYQMDEINLATVVVSRTVGFLVRDDDQMKAVAHSVANGLATGLIKIPSRAVTRMVRLEPRGSCRACSVAEALKLHASR